MVILIIDYIREKVRPIAEKYHFSKVYLFGSYARGTVTEKSDVDLAFESQNVLSYFDIFKIKSELEEILGKKVDLVPMVQLSEAKTPIGKYMFEKGFQKEKRLIA